MGHCYHHALSSARKWGGTAEDYLALHQWFDEPSKLITADFRHRALRHRRRYAVLSITGVMPRGKLCRVRIPPVVLTLSTACRYWAR